VIHSGLFVTGFVMGTFKFLFAHWATHLAAEGYNYEPHFYEIFISVQSGALVSMTVFYFSSEMVMHLAAKRRRRKFEAALKSGIPLKHKRKFTRFNKGIVWVKHNIGIYGVTLLAPLFLSIPIGSIICAKFYGDKFMTFPLMILFTASYSVLMCLLISFV
jgi:hypothetical protein